MMQSDVKEVEELHYYSQLHLKRGQLGGSSSEEIWVELKNKNGAFTMMGLYNSLPKDSRKQRNRNIGRSW